jgi:hypothetical protein
VTQTPGDLWSRLRQPLLDPRGRFAWAAPVLGAVRLEVAGVEQPLGDLPARILWNDVDSSSLAVGFGESASSPAACDVVVRLERLAAAVRFEAALSGRLAKTLSLGGAPIVGHPGAPDDVAGTSAGPFAAVAVRHLALP